MPPPALPPGFTAIACNGAPLDAAIAAAAQGADPGSVLHDAVAGSCRFAVILAPDRPIADSAVLALGSQAVHDALAALAPEHLPISLAAPGRVDVDGAQVATLAVARSDAMCPALNERIVPELNVLAWSLPDWIVLSIDVAIDLQLAEPGMTPGLTCLAEEGFQIDAPGLRAAICRTLLAGIDAWTHAEATDARAVTGRLA